jgi:hypothetical protein
MTVRVLHAWLLPGSDSGSPGHKITARAAAARIADPSSSARVSADPYLGQDATNVGRLIGPPVISGRSTAPVGIQQTEPQHITGRLPPPPPVVVKGTVPERLVLILVPYALLPPAAR